MRTTKIGKGGTVVIPAALRKRFSLEDGAQVIAEETRDGVLIRPAATVPIEIYSAERKAEFMLSNAVGKKGYEVAKKEVRKMGLDPDKVTHYKIKP